MVKLRFRSWMLLCILIALVGFQFSVSAMTAAEKAQKSAQIDALRKGDFSFTILDGAAPVSATDITVEQVRHHFGFGAAMAYWPFDSVEASKKFDKELTTEEHKDLVKKYSDAFEKYFEWITPENCMKWPDDQYEEGANNYYNGDLLIDWALARDIKVRGHNLFWNQSLEWVPAWMDSIAQTKDFAKGQEVVDYRIDSAMTHYKGRCEHWDIINEIIHGQVEIGGQTMGTLKALTGREDADIFKYVLDKAAAIDPDAKFCINDYNLVTQWSDRSDYISMVKGLINQGAKVDIIGCEGHFGGTVDINDFNTKVNDMASNFPNQEIWMTEVDFEVPMQQVPQKLEDLMTTCFAHERMFGFLIWTPWQGNLWREGYTSFVVDSAFNETAMGAKWLELLEGWTTSDQQVATDGEGKHAFNGFYGKYKVSFTAGDSTYEGFVTFEPGNNNALTLQKSEMIPEEVVLKYPLNVRFDRTGNNNGTAKRTVVFNSGALSFSIPAFEDGQLYLSAFSLSGRLLARVPLSFSSGISQVRNLPAGCHIYRIGTGRATYHTSMGLNLR